MNLDKLNNYHFGRKVFEYFPWYSYSKNLESRPILNKNLWEDLYYGLRLNGYRFSNILYEWHFLAETYVILHPVDLLSSDYAPKIILQNDRISVSMSNYLKKFKGYNQLSENDINLINIIPDDNKLKIKIK